MKLIPYESYYLITKLETEQVKRSLLNVVGLRSSNADRRTDRRMSIFKTNQNPLISISEEAAIKPYEGFVFDDDFQINRFTWHDNFFKPLIYGNYFLEPDGTIIHITMRMGWMVILLTMFICGLILFLLVLLFLNRHFNSFMISSISFLLIVYGSILFSFKTESHLTKEFLLDLFKAEYYKIKAE